MSIEKTDDLLSRPDTSSIDGTTTPETPRPRLRQVITAGASRVREAAPPRVRQASSTVRQHPAPTAGGVLALTGAVVAVLLLRRRAARAKAAPARMRWVPSRFRR